MKSLYFRLPAVISAAWFLLPDLVRAAGGKAEMLIHVADNRVVEHWFTKWWVEMYNVDPFMFGVWCTIFTALMGVTLGLVTDFVMRHTGLDLSKRSLVEH